MIITYNEWSSLLGGLSGARRAPLLPRASYDMLFYTTLYYSTLHICVYIYIEREIHIYIYIYIYVLCYTTVDHTILHYASAQTVIVYRIGLGVGRTSFGASRRLCAR